MGATRLLLSVRVPTGRMHFADAFVCCAPLQPFFCAMPVTSGEASPAEAQRPATAGRRLFQIPPSHTTPADAAAPAANTSSSSSTKPTAANIALRTIRPLTIAVNETEQSVWVDAGVIIADLLAYLASYVTPAAPSGYTLPAFPWFVYQVSRTPVPQAGGMMRSVRT